MQCVTICGADSFKSPKYDCGHNSKCDRKMLKVAVIILNVTATFNILQSDFEICNHVTATSEI